MFICIFVFLICLLTVYYKTGSSPVPTVVQKSILAQVQRVLALCPETWPKVMKAEAWSPLSEIQRCQDRAMTYQIAEV